MGPRAQGRACVGREPARGWARSAGAALGLTAQVADTYFTLRSLDAELAVTQPTLATREENVRLQTSRAKAGVVSEYDLAQAQAERASVAAAVPALQKSLAQTESALAALTGRSARDVFAPVIGRG